MDKKIFDQFFHSPPPDLDVDAIWREWSALNPPYDVNARRLPLPVWARRPFTENGEQAWANLRGEVTRIDRDKAFCIYIHIPFCASKCSFCDCYSFRLSQHRARHIETYTTTLEQEIRLWNQLGTLAHRPVSTVHFGGGTPTFLGEIPFERLVQNCRQYFNAGSQTEWALETTTSELTESMFSLLDSQGFTRLHLGVQSLEDPIRRLLNRREPAITVLEKVAKAVALGWVVSVDLLYGLPNQSLESLLNDIHSLADVGVDGFSLYELQSSSRNRIFIERHELEKRDPVFDYFLLQAASQRLAAMGYKKTLFNHFARDKDTNLYFTFPKRGEDCLALGTIADGVFNDYHFRHPEYPDYCKSVSESFPGLEAGMRQNTLENLVAPLEVAILSGALTPDLFIETLGRDEAGTLFQHWSDAALIAEDTQNVGQLRLTTNGSWFAGKMMGQVFHIACS